jgi:hypothetical protein
VAAWDAIGAAAVPSVLAAIAAYYTRFKSRQVARNRVDGEAYDRAMVINRETVVDLERRVHDLRVELDQLRRDLNDERRKVTLLIGVMRQHSIDPPEGI